MSDLESLPLQIRDWIVSWFPESFQWLVGSVTAIAAVIIVFASLFAILTLVERKALGRMQNRPGPNRTGPGGLFQPLADAIKMIMKEDIVPEAADKVIHFFAPVILVSAAVVSYAVIPYGRRLVPVELDAAIVYFFAAGAATELAVFMAGWGSHNKYSLLAAMRALAQLISYELPLLLSVVPVVLVTGSLATTAVVAAQNGWTAGVIPHWNVFTPWGAAGFLIFLIAALAESNRSPFDLPEAESELIAGHLTEYSGFKYALFFMAEYLGMTALCGLGVTLFLGGWREPLPRLALVPSYLWFGAKLLSIVALFIWIRGTFPRLRIDQLTRLAWKFLVPYALLNLGNAAFWRLSAGWTGTADIVRWLIGLALAIGPLFLLGKPLNARRQPRTYRYA